MSNQTGRKGSARKGGTKGAQGRVGVQSGDGVGSVVPKGGGGAVGTSGGDLGRGRDSALLSIDEIDDLPEVKLLNDLQRRLLLGFLQTGDKSAANRLAGYEEDHLVAASWRSRPMQEACQAVAMAEMRGVGVLRATRTMIGLMDDKNSPTIRFKAAKWVQEVAGMGQSATSGGLIDKPLAEMTQAELARFIEAQRAVIASGGNAGLIREIDNDPAAQLINITPQN